MKRSIIWIVVVIIVLVGLGVYFYMNSASPSSAVSDSGATDTAASTTASHSVGPDSTAIATAVYSCDNGHTIAAAYFAGPAQTTTVQTGQPPVPNGIAEVSLDGGPTTTLTQTISADGARYSDGNPQIAQGEPGAETFVFWNKGNTALIMRNNSMDLTYTNCATK